MSRFPTLEERLEAAKLRGIPRTAKESKAIGEKHYIGTCSKHGEQVFLTCDNSCPACCKEARNRRNTTNVEFNRSREWFNELKKRARDNGIEFDLTLDFVRQLREGATVCPALGTPFSEVEKGMGRTGHNMSMDRMDPTKGYTMDNVYIIGDRANRIKNDGTALEHLKVALYMTTDPDLRASLQATIELFEK